MSVTIKNRPRRLPTAPQRRETNLTRTAKEEIPSLFRELTSTKVIVQLTNWSRMYQHLAFNYGDPFDPHAENELRCRLWPAVHCAVPEPSSVP